MRAHRSSLRRPPTGVPACTSSANCGTSSRHQHGLCRLEASKQDGLQGTRHVVREHELQAVHPAVLAVVQRVQRGGWEDDDLAGRHREAVAVTRRRAPACRHGPCLGGRQGQAAVRLRCWQHGSSRRASSWARRPGPAAGGHLTVSQTARGRQYACEAWCGGWARTPRCQR